MQKRTTSGEGSRKRRKYLYFDQMLFLVPHLEDRKTQSNFSSERNEKEEVANKSEEENEMEVRRNVRKKNRTKISYE
jgi:hypothetical protein